MAEQSITRIDTQEELPPATGIWRDALKRLAAATGGQAFMGTPPKTVLPHALGRVRVEFVAKRRRRTSAYFSVELVGKALARGSLSLVLGPGEPLPAGLSEAAADALRTLRAVDLGSAVVVAVAVVVVVAAAVVTEAVVAADVGTKSFILYILNQF